MKCSNQSDECEVQECVAPYYHNSRNRAKCSGGKNSAEVIY